MKPALIALLLAIALALPALAADDPTPAVKPDLDALAKKVITRCARVTDADVVQISGAARDAAFLESLMLEASKLGADVLPTLAPGEAMMRRVLLESPARFDARVSPAALKLTEVLTVMVGVDSTESDAAFADFPPDRLNARMDAATKLKEAMLKRNVRQIYIGNGLYPTEQRAQQFGLARPALAKLFYGGLDVDYDQMQATGESVRKVLAAGKSGHITTPDGTDLTLEITARPAFVSDGVLSDDKLKRGGPACQVWLPAGEVYVTPVPGTAEGKVVLPRSLWEGKEVRGLTLTFRKGRLTEMKADSGLERLKSLYDAAGEGKDLLGLLDVGINPAVALPKSSPAGAYMAAGTITVSVGTNLWAGGDNKASFELPCHLRGGTLEIDGKPLVKDGALRMDR